MSNSKEAINSTKSLESDFQKLFINIADTAQHLESYVAKSLKKHDLTIPQYNVLRLLKVQEGEPIKAVHLQKKMIHKTSNISRILDKLEEKDFAKRVDCDENRRVRNVFINRKGEKILKEVEYILQDLYASMDENLKKYQLSPHFVNELLDNFRKI